MAIIRQAATQMIHQTLYSRRRCLQENPELLTTLTMIIVEIHDEDEEASALCQ